MKRLVLLVLLTSAMLYSETPQWSASEIKLDDINLYRYIIKADGQEKEFYSFDSNVEKTLDKENVVLGDRDYLSITYDNHTYYVKVVRRHEEFSTEVEEISFNGDLTEGAENGQPGLKEVTYRVVIEEGQEKYREPYTEVIIKTPKPEAILKEQSSKAITASRGPVNVKKTLSMEASAYTHTGNRTYTGVYPEAGTIAVDPKIIPLGTRLWVEGYGYGIAEDIGSAIKGNKIDLFMESRRECLHWGRRRVRVYILP